MVYEVRVNRSRCATCEPADVTPSGFVAVTSADGRSVARGGYRRDALEIVVEGQ